MLDVDEARQITARAQRHPVESSRQVLMVDRRPPRRGRARRAGALEDGRGATAFDRLRPPRRRPPCHARHHRQPLRAGPLRLGARVGDRGVAGGERCRSGPRRLGGGGVGGQLDRARLLVDDPGFAARQEQWRTVPEPAGRDRGDCRRPSRASCWTGSRTPSRRSAPDTSARWPTWRSRRRRSGRRGIPGRRQIEERQRREARRLRTDELRHGLAVLSGVYRDRLASLASNGDVAPTPGGRGSRRRAARQVEAIREASDALTRNANEVLMMDALMVELSGMTD